MKNEMIFFLLACHQNFVNTEIESNLYPLSFQDLEWRQPTELLIRLKTLLSSLYKKYQDNGRETEVRTSSKCVTVNLPLHEIAYFLWK